MSTPSTPDASSPKRTTLSRELSEFLIELSIGVHRYAMYPPGHPSLEPAVQGIIKRLGPLLANRHQLSLGVARRQLVIEGLATEKSHPVLSDLARRLHDLQLGAVSFEVGVGGDEIIGLLGTLAEDPDPEEVPLGLRPESEIPNWPHVHLYALGYDRLAMKDEASKDRLEDRLGTLWLGLAQAALAGLDLEDGEADPRTIARSIREHGREAAYDQVIVGYMLQLAAELKLEQGAGSEQVRGQLAELLQEMDPDTLRRLLDMGGDFSARRQFVLDANQSLAVDSVLKVLNAAAQASGQTVSTSMTRLLSKLATHADQGQGRLKTQASAALQDNVERLLDGWELDDPNPDEYTRVLDAISRAAPIFGEDGRREPLEGGTEEVPGPLRLVEMGLEIDAYGPTVEAAILDLINLGYAAKILEMARQAPADSRVARDILGQMTSPAQIRRYLGRADVEEETLTALIESMGSSAIPPFLDALAESESRAVRRKVFDRLAGMGREAAEEALGRIPGEERWYVLRNWLALVHHYPEVAAEFDAMPYVQHADARVRREALPVALARESLVQRALAAGLADPDDRNCRMALSHLPSPVPDPLVPTLVKRVLQANRDPQLRAAGIRVLRDNHTPFVRDALLGLAAGGRSLLGKPKLAEVGPVLLAALSVLGTEWPGDPAVHPVLELAEKSKDPEVRKAVEAP